ncbi:hypothetical protein [Leifsonia sp. TF02-11]|uniref:DUF7426 family protein n=1 Tax=Leifsonia sp. TF02-11 TaxID=2815212 RepID=UPI001AA115FC|nr:hypothetical protein [Leifsonia sp. TF02-11]MBO1739665.1 hypothetical protein [Leifsonia sp. TF02-11]
MAFKEFEEIVEPLVLPIAGKKYTVPSIGIADGIRLAANIDPKSTEQPLTNDEFRRITLGTALEEMIADNVPSLAVALAAQTALVDYQTGRAAAEIFWETGGDPKGMSRKVDEARAALTAAAMTPPAAARTTRRRATGSGTKTSRKS